MPVIRRHTFSMAICCCLLIYAAAVTLISLRASQRRHGRYRCCCCCYAMLAAMRLDAKRVAATPYAMPRRDNTCQARVPWRWRTWCAMAIPERASTRVSVDAPCRGSRARRWRVASKRACAAAVVRFDALMLLIIAASAADFAATSH